MDMKTAFLTIVAAFSVGQAFAETVADGGTPADVAVQTTGAGRYFTDKDDLLLAAFERAADPTPFQQAVAAIDPGLPFEERLVAATALMQRRLLDITRLHSQIDPAGRRPAPDRLPDDPAMTAVFESAPESVRLAPNEAARQLRAVVLNLSNPVFVDPPLDARQIVDLFLHGVGSDR